MIEYDLVQKEADPLNMSWNATRAENVLKAYFKIRQVAIFRKSLVGVPAT
jgi:hypothetical protein